MGDAGGSGEGQAAAGNRDVDVSGLAATLAAVSDRVPDALGAAARAAGAALRADRASCYTVSADGVVEDVYTTEADPFRRGLITSAAGRRLADMPAWLGVFKRADPLVVVPDTGSGGVPVGLARAMRAGAFMGVRLDGLGDDAPELGYMLVSWARPRPIGHRAGQLMLALATVVAPLLATARLQTRTLHALRLARRDRSELEWAQRLASVGSWSCDPATGDARWSEECRRILGQDTEEAASLGAYLECVHPGDRAGVAAELGRLAASGEPYELQHRVVRPDGDVRTVRLVREVGREGEVDGPYSHFGVVQDITERVRADERLAFRGRLLDAVDAAVIATDLAGRVTFWNRGAERLYGWSRAEVVGREISSLNVAPDDRRLAHEIMTSVRRRGAWEGRFSVRSKEGRTFPAHVTNTLLRDPDGRPAGVIGVSVDMSASVAMEGELRSTRDFLSAVTASVGEALLALDDAGRVTYMNPAAERMLGWSARELHGAVVEDVVAMTGLDGSGPSRPLRAELDSGQARFEASVVRRDGCTVPASVVSAPFRAAGGLAGSVVVLTDISERIAREDRLRRDVESLTWAGRIRGAIAEDRLTVYAQPIIELATGAVTQHELLVRILGPGSEVIPPGRFLPVAEESGLIGDIDRRVAGRAAELARQGHRVHLNVSAASVGDPAFYTDLERELIGAGADPARVVVELTETALLGDEAAGRAFVERVQSLGCQVALDDFGAGYGGFRYLKHLPVDLLKIDIEFVRDLRVNPASRHVVEAVVSLARVFGQRTVAEGVEDRRTLRLLADLGVDFAQGYGIGRPAPADLLLRPPAPATTCGASEPAPRPVA